MTSVANDDATQSLHHSYMTLRAALLSTILPLCACAIAPTSSAALLFSDNFDSFTSDSNWNTNRSGSDSVVDYAFDYSTLGIPAAPNSNATTIGMRFLVNQDAGIFQGISASPVGQSFTGDFTIKFDLWINFVGTFPLGGSGSTQSASFGWGTSGTTTQWAGAKHSVMFSATGDGGSAQDYRAYLTELAPTSGAPISPVSGVYAAGTTTSPDSRNNSDVYYNGFGQVSAPTAQIEKFPNQTGVTAQGTLGMAWHKVAIEKSGDNVSWFVDDLRIATVPITGASLGGDNIFFGMFDINATSSTDANDFLNAAIYDNIRVETVPEPSAVVMLASGMCLLLRRRRLRC